MTDGSVVLCDMKIEGLSVYVSAELTDGKIVISGQDLGARVEALLGEDEYEYFRYLDEENTQKLYRALETEYPGTDGLLALVKKVFSGIQGWSKFTDFCKEKAIRTEYFSC